MPREGCLTLEAARTRRYDVHLTADLFGREGSDPLGDALAGRRVLVCTTPTVDGLYGARLRRFLVGLGHDPAWLVVDCPERAKTVETATRICEAALERGLDRRGVLLAFGGGACSDLVTVAAGMIRRGVGHIRVPTTLVGQIDAGVGLKGAVNLGTAKNYLGCFHPPEAVVVDPALLLSLPEDAMRQGVAEIVKIACVRDADLFGLLRRDAAELVASRFGAPRASAAAVIEGAIAGMLAELGTNPFEDRSHARAVDFGHTVSPTLEAATGYRLHHGFAVAIDVAFSCVLGALLGLLPDADAEAIVSLLLDVGLPVDHPLLDAELVARAFEGVTLHRGGELNLVVPTRIGACTFVRSVGDVGGAIVGEALRRLGSLAAQGADRDLAA